MCNHAWETVQQCFECGAIRPFEDTVDTMSEQDRKCPAYGLKAWRLVFPNGKTAEFATKSIAEGYAADFGLSAPIEVEL